MARNDVRLNPWGGLLVGLLVTGVCAAGDFAEDPLLWLARMETALTSRNYVGVFVHEHAGQTETLQVIHRSVGVPAERLVSMDGSGREFIRKGGDLLTYLPDQRAVLVEKSTDRSLVLGSLPHMDASLTSRYDVRELASRRLLGRDTRVIAIEPKDQYRFGYRLWIDEATAMPLKSQLRDARDAVVEQIVFTSLKLPAQVADIALEPAVDAKGFHWVRYQSTTVADSSAATNWQAEQLPAGFRLTARATQQMPGAAEPVAHLVFSDGLASVSVFVEMKADTPATGRSDVARVGSSSAYSTVIDGHRVTVIGEVPPETVRAIASSLRLEGGTPSGSTSTAAAVTPVPSRPATTPRRDVPIDPFSSGVGGALQSLDGPSMGFAPRTPAFGTGGNGSDNPSGFGGPASGAGPGAPGGAGLGGKGGPH